MKRLLPILVLAGMTVSSCGLLDMLGLGNRADMWESTFGNRRIRRPASGDTSITMATGISSHSTGMRPACMKKAVQSCSLPMNFGGGYRQNEQNCGTA